MCKWIKLNNICYCAALCIHSFRAKKDTFSLLFGCRKLTGHGASSTNNQTMESHTCGLLDAFGISKTSCFEDAMQEYVTRPSIKCPDCSICLRTDNLNFETVFNFFFPLSALIPKPPGNYLTSFSCFPHRKRAERRCSGRQPPG